MPGITDVPGPPSCTNQPPLSPKRQASTSVLKMIFSDHTFDPYDPFGYGDVRDYFDSESDFMVSEGYSLNLKNKQMRQAALYVILQIMGNVEVDVFVVYLAMTYFDRYTSRKGFTVILQNQRESIMEDVEFLIFCCISIAHQATLSLGIWSLDFKAQTKKLKLETDIRQFLAKRTKNVRYFKECDVSGTVKNIKEVLGNSLQSNPITPLCFIDYFRSEAQYEVPEAKQNVTRIVLELQDDIRFCQYKPSVISASAVTAFVSCHCPEHYETLKERMKSLERIKDKEDFSRCVELVKEVCSQKKLTSDFGASRDFKLDWKIADGIEDFIRRLDSLTRYSTQLTAMDLKIRQLAEMIRSLIEEIVKPPRPEDEEELKKLKVTLKEWVKNFGDMKKLMAKMMKRREVSVFESAESF